MLIIGMIFAAALICGTYAEAEVVPYADASSWAVPELERASEYGFITDKVSEDMSKPIRREELAELVVRLYEKYTGEKAAAADADTFRDTKNPEVLKAYKLGIVEGTDSFWRLFSPGASATREQVAVMLHRTIKAMYPEADIDIGGAAAFSDEADISGWASEAVSFMSSNEFIKGGDGRIYPGETCSREMAVIITMRVYEKYSPGNNEHIQEDQETGGAESGVSLNLELLVINDTIINGGGYHIIEKGGKPYILIAEDKFKYAFKQPDAGYYTYPEVSIIGSSISITWNNENGIAMHVEMQENRSEALLNGAMIDMGVAPYSQYGIMYIPIDFLLAERQMDIEAGIEGDILYIQYSKDFSKDALTGTWSDSGLDMFENLDKITAGSFEAVAFSTGYRFNSDGTYSHCMASILEDSNDTLILEEGQYRISGNTILCYDITETVYKGHPFELQYADKKQEIPQYLFIYNYEPGTERIELGGFWLKKL